MWLQVKLSTQPVYVRRGEVNSGIQCSTHVLPQDLGVERGGYLCCKVKGLRRS